MTATGEVSSPCDRLIVGDPEKLTIECYSPQNYYRVIELLESRENFLVFEKNESSRA